MVRPMPVPERLLLLTLTSLGSSDARRPCTTCVRSHRNTVSHAPPGIEVPSLECTFDEVENSAQPHSAPKNRYERLENRISNVVNFSYMPCSTSSTMKYQASLKGSCGRRRRRVAAQCIRCLPAVPPLRRFHPVQECKV